MYLGTLFGTTWGYPGLLEAILDHLGGILGPRASETPPGWQCLCPGIAILSHFGVNFGTENRYFLVIFGVILWITYRSLFGTLLEFILGPFWDQIGPRRGQDEPKRAVKSFKEQKIQHLRTP